MTTTMKAMTKTEFAGELRDVRDRFTTACYRSDASYHDATGRAISAYETAILTCLDHMIAEIEQSL